MSESESDQLRRRVEDFLREHDPAATDTRQWRGAQFDAGLAWVYFPEGNGGLGLPRSLQPLADDLFRAAGATDDNVAVSGIGLGMAAPTIVAYGTPAQQHRYLRPLWTGEEVWCQLFSEPDAGSDLAGLGTRAVPDSDRWVINGQKVWTSSAHNASWAILLARTDPDVPKHRGITYFLCPMDAAGVEVRPLRQITGEAEFNEVFLADVTIPDSYRLGGVGEGWRIANTTLNNERVSIGGRQVPREAGMIGQLAQNWRNHPQRRTPQLHDRLLRLWVEAEAARLGARRLAQKLAVGQPGPEGAAMKVTFARNNQAVSGLETELEGDDGLRYNDWTMQRPTTLDFTGKSAGWRYLRAKGNSIEGGTSEILKNIIAERVLGLPAEPRVDKDVAWKDMPR
jgi:alkylation response protein AidB-like acyl-CoA dehydrogenase